jgi:hypothetical protein
MVRIVVRWEGALCAAAHIRGVIFPPQKRTASQKKGKMNSRPIIIRIRDASACPMQSHTGRRADPTGAHTTPISGISPRTAPHGRCGISSRVRTPTSASYAWSATGCLLAIQPTALVDPTATIMQTGLPADGFCPTCSGSLRLQARTVYSAMIPTAHDELEWLCAKCGHTEVEHRRKGDGVDDDWPASKFQR